MKAPLALLAVLASLLIAGAAYGTSRVTYSGKTSQHLAISFAISSGNLTKLDVKIQLRCPSHHRYQLDAGHFTAITINGSAFSQKFTNPEGTFRLQGHVGHRKVTGSVSLREFISREHHFCSARATFVARPHK